MGWSMRRSAKVGPFRLNLSKRGVGISTGVRGVHYSIGPRGTYFTASLPGGLRYRKKLAPMARRPRRVAPRKQPHTLTFADALPRTVAEADLALARLPDKSAGTAALLGLFPGGGQFYLRQFGMGLVTLLTCWLFLPWLWAYVAAIKRAGVQHHAHLLMLDQRQALMHAGRI